MKSERESEREGSVGGREGERDREREKGLKTIFESTDLTLLSLHQMLRFCEATFSSSIYMHPVFAGLRRSIIIRECVYHRSSLSTSLSPFVCTF